MARRTEIWPSKQHPKPWDWKTEKRNSPANLPETTEQWLDRGHGSYALLRNRDAARIVPEALRHFDGDRYILDAFVVMPNQKRVHLLVQPQSGNRLSEILRSWKTFSAKSINDLLGGAMG